MPYFLRDTYDFLVLHVLGRDFMLMIDVREEEASPATIRKHAEQLERFWQGEVIYVREQVTSYNRNRLIQNKVPFIVPKNQMYLPMLGMDLRERFVAKRTQVEKLSPAAHVLVLHSLYERRALFDDSITMTEWGEELGYTKMSMTRAFRELRSILDEVERLSEIRGKELWGRVLPYLNSPSKRLRHYDFDVFGEKDVLAGESALAVYSTMAEPSARTVCMTGEVWKQKYSEEPFEVQHADQGTTDVQIWRYDPTRFARDDVADPLSVYLSFKDSDDERIEVALEELIEKVKW